MVRILEGHINHRIADLEDRVEEMEDCWEAADIGHMEETIIDIQVLIKKIIETNKEILYRIQKAQLKDKGHRQGSF